MRTPVPARPGAGRAVSGALAVVLLATLVAGCGITPDFPDQDAGPFRPKPEIGQHVDPQPESPGTPGPPGSGSPGAPPGPPQGCADPDPQVITTCLEPISALVVLDGAALVGLAAERTTGRILRVQRERPAQVVTSLPVDASGDGGLTGLALSPSYAEDELLYAYITTAVDNRVVRIAPDDVPKPVLTGIPKGPRGNAGALTLDSAGMLVVATGNAGDPAAAADPNSLAGKVLRIDTSGRPAPGNATGSKVLAAGLHEPGGLCADPISEELWVTDRAPGLDVLHRVQPGAVPGSSAPGSSAPAPALGAPAWTWPDQPGAAGCVVLQNRIQVAFTSGAPMFALSIGPNGTFLGRPLEIPLDRYGQVSAAARSPEGRMVWLATINKSGGQPISSDERVFVLTDPVGPGGGHD